MNHDKWLRARGLAPDQIAARKDRSYASRAFLRSYADGLKVDRSSSRYASLSTRATVDACADRSIMARLHRESPEVQRAILDKAKRTAPAYSKGGYQYITDSPHDLGKKK